MTSNFEDMLHLPDTHVLDKIILLMEFSAGGVRLFGKFVDGQEGAELPPGYFRKDIRAVDRFRDEHMKRAVSKYYLKAAQAEPNFKPEELPDAMLGLKDYWGLVVGRPSGTVEELVPNGGYEALKSVPATTPSSVTIIRDSPDMTIDELKEALVQQAVSLVTRERDAYITQSQLMECIHASSTIIQRKALYADGPRQFEKYVYERFAEALGTKWTRPATGSAYVKGAGGAVRCIKNMRLPSLREVEDGAAQASSSGGGGVEV